MTSLKHLLNNVLICILLVISASCAYIIKASDSSKVLIYQKNRFNLTDKSGSYWLLREAGFKAEKKEFVVKQKIIIEGKDEQSPLEKSVSISKLGTLEKGLSILRPVVSQFTVWFDGKKYFNEMRVSDDQKSIMLKLQSPEHKWNGTKQIDISNKSKVICFYSQVIECASITGFLKKSLKRRMGKMHFDLLWDGFPYFQQQYVGVNENLIEKAVLQYDGVLKRGETRFSLEVSGQVIFFIVDDKGSLIKKFWVSQGLSMIKR